MYCRPYVSSVRSHREPSSLSSLEYRTAQNFTHQRSWRDALRWDVVRSLLETSLGTTTLQQVTRNFPRSKESTKHHDNVTYNWLLLFIVCRSRDCKRYTDHTIQNIRTDTVVAARFEPIRFQVSYINDSKDAEMTMQLSTTGKLGLRLLAGLRARNATDQV